MKKITVVNGTKPCSSCKNVLPLTSYHKDGTTSTGYRGRCKACARQQRKPTTTLQNQLSHRKHKDKRNKQSADYAHSFHGRSTMMFLQAKKRAERSGMVCSISVEWIKNKWTEQGGRCLLTGIPFDLSRPTERDHSNPHSPSIDRIDSTLGYTPGNTRLVLTAMNIALGTWGEDQFEAMCKAYLTQRASRSDPAT
jgi:hypothetical protein